MNMQGSIFFCNSKHQTAWSIFIIRVIFDDFTAGDCFPKLPDRYSTDNTLINGVL